MVEKWIIYIMMLLPYKIVKNTKVPKYFVNFFYY